MPHSALALVLTAAVLHATWNLAAKRAGGGLPFVTVVGLVILAAYVPALAVYAALHGWPALTPAAVGVMVASGLLRTGYSLYLQRAYRHGDFSLVYPLARGTGPVFSIVAAIVIFGERPSALALAGAGAIVGAVFWLAGGSRLWRRQGGASPPGAATPAAAGLRYGLTTGLFIAAYTVWDRHGVRGHAIPPLLFDAGAALTQVLALAPLAWPRRAEVVATWRTQWRLVLIVALLSPVSYVLVLTALTLAPMSLVAPAREVSIVIGAFLGAHLLREGDARRRLIAAGVMTLGVVALAAG